MIEFPVSFHEVFLEMKIKVKLFNLYHMGTVVQIFPTQMLLELPRRVWTDVGDSSGILKYQNTG